jgi:ketosteroid isomerase-like protein
MNDSKSSIELLYEVMGAYQQGDEEKVRDLMHPEAEVHGAPGLINAGTYYGYEGYQQWLQQWDEAWDEINYELGEPIDVDESIVVVPVHVVGVGAVSGLRIDAIFGWLYQFQEGLARRFHVYPDVEEAVEAAKRLAAERV